MNPLPNSQERGNSSPEDAPPKNLRVFVLLLTLHTALLVASNAGGAKMIAVPGGLAASATVFSYMATFAILDVIAELYGKKYSQLTINLGLLGLVLSVVFYQLTIAAPPADFWKGQEAYELTLGTAWRILLGGWTAYMVAQYLDVWGFLRLKQSAFGAKNLWWRSWASTALAQILDTVIFMFVAFYGVFPLLPAIAGQYILKLILAAIAIPVIYGIVAWAKTAALTQH